MTSNFVQAFAKLDNGVKIILDMENLLGEESADNLEEDE